MADQLIDAAMARALHADACRGHALVGWVVMRDPPEYPDRVTARLVTETPLALRARRRHPGRDPRPAAAASGARRAPAGRPAGGGRDLVLRVAADSPGGVNKRRGVNKPRPDDLWPSRALGAPCHAPSVLPPSQAAAPARWPGSFSSAAGPPGGPARDPICCAATARAVPASGPAARRRGDKSVTEPARPPRAAFPLRRPARAEWEGERQC
jgi:hypothetical protein